MKYFAVSKRDGCSREISREEAKDYLKANYDERVCTYDEMLEMENSYPCRFSVIEVKAE